MAKIRQDVIKYLTNRIRKMNANEVKTKIFILTAKYLDDEETKEQCKRLAKLCGNIKK